MTEAGRSLADTDWHVDRLYDFLGALGASVIAAGQSRYLIDINRAPDGRVLYAGASNTELCPTSTFAEEAIYQEGEEPDEAEIAARRAGVWQPYHERLAAELAAIRARHGIALLWTPTRSAARCRASSRGGCRTSTSAPAAGRARTRG